MRFVGHARLGSASKSCRQRNARLVLTSRQHIHTILRRDISSGHYAGQGIDFHDMALFWWIMYFLATPGAGSNAILADLAACS